MHRFANRFLTGSFGVLCVVGTMWGGTPAAAVNVPVAGFVQVSDDDDTPEVTDRVARISFIDGEARIRRTGSDEWETLTLNLPLVEGDEISTEVGARVEIQFDKDQHVRLDESSFLKIANLKDEGIALSISRGSLSLRVTEFDKERAFFEIDAPKTTIAVQIAGRYRIDAGRDGDIEVRTSISEGGEARIYSDNAGFTLKDGRSARIYIDGQNAGEWETGDVSRYDDGFSDWTLDRERVVAQRLKDAFYDKYYDQDIYGAEDLNGYGDWISTSDYGQVWQPSPRAISQYSDWSPYRYGHWRYMQPYGWTWVNDEPWGWATYHHGRWISYNGRWVWSPYGYYRHARSWWSPALVVINIFNNNVCWYPLPYHRRRYNYNWNHQTPRVTKVSTRTPRNVAGNPNGIIPPTKRSLRNNQPIRDEVPASGVVLLDKQDFGTRKTARSVTPLVAKTVLSRDPVDGKEVKLPQQTVRQRNSDIATARPSFEPAKQTRVGAAPRKPDVPMDAELRTTKILRGRPPLITSGNDDLRVKESNRSTEPRKTGAVERPQPVRQVDEAPKTRRPAPVDEPVKAQPRQIETPRYVPPPSRETPRATPRYDPPKQTERTRTEPPTRSTPPPSKSEPKPVDKPAPPARKEKPITR